VSDEKEIAASVTDPNPLGKFGTVLFIVLSLSHVGMAVLKNFIHLVGDPTDISNCI
jgi:hypothetical protein